MSVKTYQPLVDHYESCFEKFGTTPKGVDWPNEQDLYLRFKIMLDICRRELIAGEPISILDLGCGYGALYDFLQQQNVASKVHYTGVDLSEKMITSAKQRHPTIDFQMRDILIDQFALSQFDYVLMNGLLTEKTTMPQDEMETFTAAIVKEVFGNCKKGVAFNVMSEHVDWKRDDLFHMPFDRMAVLLKKNASRHFTFRADYGLHEYAVYVYKKENNY
jgi:SAM-dependent methyltransferase